jgi:UDP-N-acetylmuramate--alanine ligase
VTGTLSFFFCGIGGSGMSALAAILRRRGANVAGSDRGRDQGQSPEKFAALEAMGIKLFPQDGSGVAKETDLLVVSTAVEDSIPDVQAAKKLGVPVRRRADILAGMLNGRKGLAVAGTSGKTTVTGMAGVIFAECGFDPAVVNGGVMLNFLDQGPGNVRVGDGEWFIAETDESDGSIALYKPEIAVLNNVTFDHKPIPELRPLFADFMARTKTGVVLNIDDVEAAALKPADKNVLTFGLGRDDADITARDIELKDGGSSFDVFNRRTGEQAACILHVAGRHNISNALAAIGAALLAGIDLRHAVAALAKFKGIRRRLEVVGQACGVTVIDDFAHNPDKIAASLATLAQTAPRLLVLFQPHGFGPMRMMRKELVQSFAQGLRGDDILFMPEIFYAGGTAVRDISSSDITGDIAAAGRHAVFLPTRAQAADEIVRDVRPGDCVVVMGARDDTLSDFARDILRRAGEKLAKKSAAS